MVQATDWSTASVPILLSEEVTSIHPITLLTQAQQLWKIGSIPGFLSSKMRESTLFCGVNVRGRIIQSFLMEFISKWHLQIKKKESSAICCWCHWGSEEIFNHNKFTLSHKYSNKTGRTLFILGKKWLKLTKSFMILLFSSHWLTAALINILILKTDQNDYMCCEECCSCSTACNCLNLFSPLSSAVINQLL